MSSRENVTSMERQRMIAEAAYFRAERRGFNGGDAVRDWCEAEAEIDAQLRTLEDGQIVERIEEALQSAAEKVAAVRRKVARLSSDARGEWERDVARLGVLRDALTPKLADLKERGERAGRQLREQAETIHHEIADLVQRLEVKAKQHSSARAKTSPPDARP